MKGQEIGRAYATALFESFTQSERSNILSVLKEVSSTLVDSEVQFFFKNPLVSEGEKKEIFLKSLDSSSINETLKNFFQVVADKGRVVFLPNITNAFEDLIHVEEGVVRGTVYSVTDLEQNEKDQVIQSIEKVVQKKVKLDYQKDESLLGGLVAEVGSWRFDDSLKSHLKKMNDELNRSVN